MSKYLGFLIDDHFQQDDNFVVPFERLALKILPQLFSGRYVSIVAKVMSNPKQIPPINLVICFLVLLQAVMIFYQFSFTKDVKEGLKKINLVKVRYEYLS